LALQAAAAGTPAGSMRLEDLSEMAGVPLGG